MTVVFRGSCSAFPFAEGSMLQQEFLGNTLQSWLVGAIIAAVGVVLLKLVLGVVANRLAKLVGKPAPYIAQNAGINVPAETQVLIAELDGVGREYPLSREKLSPVLSFYTVDNWREGCERCIELLEFGGSIISENVSAKHMINVKRLAFETRPINPPDGSSLQPKVSETASPKPDIKPTVSHNIPLAKPTPAPTKSWMEEIGERIRLKASNAPLTKKENPPSSPSEHKSGPLGS